MAKYLLDTNICVFILRGSHNISHKLKETGIENCAISEITVAELLYGVECCNKPEEMHRVVTDFCSALEVVPISASLRLFASQKALLRKRGMPIDDFDLLIACTAIANDYIMVTDNRKHFERIEGINLQNWVQR